MSLSDIINYGLQTIFGILSIVGLYYTIKQVFPSQLLFIEKDFISLYSSIVREINDIEIKYKGQSINEKLFLVKGFFHNNGLKDISKEDVDSKLKAILKNGNWLEVKITDKPEDSSFDAKIENNNEIEFDFTLLKRNESFSFEALAESENQEIFFKHRIANVGKVKRIKISDLNVKSKQNIIYALIAFFFWLLIYNQAINETLYSSYLYRYDWKTLVTHKFDMRYKMPADGDTTIAFSEPLTNFTMLGQEALDTLAIIATQENNILKYIYFNKDTTLTYELQDFGTVKMTFNKDALEEFKILILILIILTSMLTTYTVRSIRYFVYWRRYRHVK